MYLNRFSEDLGPLDLSTVDEFASLQESARDLGIDAPAQTRYTSRNTVFRGQRFHFLEWGDPSKPTIVLLHGSNQSAHSWDLVSLHLSRNWHVYALDQRGHGDSEWSKAGHYSVQDMALDLAAFLENVVGPEGAAKDRKPVIVGHSMGGMVTLTHAHQNPHLMSAIGVVDIGPEVNAEGTKMIREFVGRNVEFADMEVFLDRVAQYDRYRSREHIAKTLKYNLMQRPDGVYVTKNDRRRYHPEAGTPAARTPTLEELATLDMPVLIVRGGDSNVLVDDAANRFVSALRQGKLVTIDNCGHNVASQNTVGFLGALTSFLDTL